MVYLCLTSIYGKLFAFYVIESFEMSRPRDAKSTRLVMVNLTICVSSFMAI